MPSKIQLDENLWFLYICLQKSDLKTIDFAAVGASTNLKPPAARMRYTRLRRQIESGTLIGTHGQPFAGSAEKIYEASAKRKRPDSESKSVVKGDDDETEDEDPMGDLRDKKKGDVKAGTAQRGGGKVRGKGTVKRGGKAGRGRTGVKVKEEENELSSDASRFEDSEDEMPLAKLRKENHGPFQSPSANIHTSTYPSLGGIPRTMVGFELATMGGQGFGQGSQSPGGFNPNSEHGGTSGNVAGRGWGEVDWAKWRSRFGGGQAVMGLSSEV